MKETLFQNFELKGSWWLPNMGDSAVDGILKYEENKISLELFGSFKSIIGLTINDKVVTEDVILGFTNDGKKITLLDNYESSFNMNFPGKNSSIYSSQVLLINEHYASKDEIAFDYALLSLTNLEYWINQSAFALNIDENEKSSTVTAKTLPIKKFTIPSIGGSIETVSSINMNGNYYLYAHYDHTVFLKVTPENPFDFTRFFELEVSMNNLLSLLIWTPIYSKRLIGVTQLDQQDQGEEKRVYIYYTSKRGDAKTEIDQFDMIFTLPQIIAASPNVFEEWFGKADKLKPVFDLFFGSFYNSNTYLNFHFLAHSQALETFHRNKFGGEFMSDEEYEKHRKVLTNAIPVEIKDEDFRQSLKSRIKFGNEYSLRKRIKEILNLLDSELVGIITNDVNGFIQKIVETRNYFTHYGEKSRFVLEGKNLAIANKKLQLLLLILLYKELGVDESWLKSILLEHRKFQRVIQWEI